MKKYAVYYTIRTGINRQIVVEDCVNAARPLPKCLVGPKRMCYNGYDSVLQGRI
jgi:hypothetical protein